MAFLWHCMLASFYTRAIRILFHGMNPLSHSLPHFRARVVAGSGRGRALGVPTLNLRLEDVPMELPEGIYACFAIIHEKKMPGALHYGPRPVFEDEKSCEVHLLDHTLNDPPPEVHIEVIERLRAIRDFPSADALKGQMQEDIDQARAILKEKGGYTPSLSVF